MIARFAEIEKFACECLTEAVGAIESIQFSMNEKYAKHLQTRSLEASYIGDVPAYQVLKCGYGIAAHSAILSVDLRQSSRRAVTHGPKNTYLTMHTYLPTMAEVVASAEGLIVGLRGDGLIAAFGVTEKAHRDAKWPDGPNATKQATHCGKAMIEATEEIINPLLEAEDIPAGLQIGVGIAVGEVVITRIGLRPANEVTAYGAPVNQACKFSDGTNRVRLSKGAYDIFPTTKGGRIRFETYSDSFIPTYPRDMLMLERDDKSIGQQRPR